MLQCSNDKFRVILLEFGAICAGVVNAWLEGARHMKEPPDRLVLGVNSEVVYAKLRSALLLTQQASVGAFAHRTSRTAAALQQCENSDHE